MMPFDGRCVSIPGLVRAWSSALVKLVLFLDYLSNLVQASLGLDGHKIASRAEY